jgi:exopolysaccharide production protein ExoZ
VLLWYTRAHDFPFAVAISMGIIVSGFVNLSMPASRAPFRWLVAVGNASYSIYLLHYIVFLVSTVVAIQWVGLTLPPWACEPWRFAIILVCCLISSATWRLFERPMIALGNEFANARPLLRPAKVGD